MNDLNENNFLIYAIKSYNSINYVMSEFEEDMNRIKYLKRLFRQYRIKKTLRERLIINHLICLSNVLGVEPMVRILFFKMDKEDFSSLKTFLLYLNYMPEVVENIEGNNIFSSNISVDLNIADVLRKL